MRPPIAEGVSTREMFFNTMKADSDLVALLTNGVNGILPSKDLDPMKVAKPFVWLRFEGGGTLGTDGMDLGIWVIEAHDRPGYGLVKVDLIVARLKILFQHQTWPRPTASSERPRMSYWAGATGELPDNGFHTIKRIARIQLVQS